MMEADGNDPAEGLMALLNILNQSQVPQNEPLMKLRQEYFKSAIPMQPIIQSAKEDAAKTIRKITKIDVLNTAQEYLKVLSPPSGVCARELGLDDIAWTCVTCSVLKQQMAGVTVLCMECVKNGDHEGHELKIQRQTQGTCDCGEPDFIKPEGFCKLHRGKGVDDLNFFELDPQIQKPLEECIVQSVTSLERAALDFEHPGFNPKTNVDKAKKLYKSFLYSCTLLEWLARLNTYAVKKISEELMKVSGVVNFKHSQNYNWQGKCRPWIHSDQEEDILVDQAKGCACARLDNIMRCFYKIQEEPRQLFIKVGYRLLRSLKFKVCFTLCYTANYQQAILTTHFLKESNDIYDDLIMQTLPLERVTTKVLLKKKAISNIMIALHEGQKRRITENDSTLNLKQFLLHWTTHFGYLVNNKQNLFLIHNVSIIQEMLLNEMMILDFFFQAKRPEKQLPPFIPVHRVDNTLLLLIEKFENSVMPVALSFPILQTRFKDQNDKTLQSLGKMVMNVLKQTDHILRDLNQKNLFSYVYEGPKYVSILLMRVLLVYFERGDFEKRIKMRQNSQQSKLKSENVENLEKAVQLSQSGQPLQLDCKEVVKEKKESTEINESNKESEEKSEKKVDGAQQQMKVEETKSEEDKMPKIVTFARRAILNVLRITDTDEFKLMIALLFRVGFGLSNLFFDVEVGWWNRLGIEVIRLQGYYYRSINDMTIPRYLPDYGLIQLGIFLGWTPVIKNHYERRIQGYVEKLNSLKELSAQDKDLEGVVKVVENEIELVLHQMVNVIISPKPIGAVIAKCLEKRTSLGLPQDQIKLFQKYMRQLIRIEIIHALAQLQEPRKGALYEVVLKVTDGVLNQFPQFEEEFKELTEQVEGGDSGGIHYRLALQNPEINQEVEMTLDPYFYERTSNKAKLWQIFPNSPLGRLVKEKPSIGIRAIPWMDELREVCTAFDAEFLTTHLVLEDVKTHLTENHKVDILKLFALGLQFREYDPEGKKFTEVESSLIRDILINIRTAECEGEANRTLRAAINQLLKYLEMEGELSLIEAQEKKALDLLNKDDEKQKLRLKKEKAKAKALKKLKKNQKKFAEKNEVAKEEEQKQHHQNCCLCHEKLDKQHRKHPWGRACFIGKNRLLYHGYKNAIRKAREQLEEVKDLPEEIKNPDELLPLPKKFMLGGLTAKSCGHYLHYKCLNEMKADAQMEQKYMLNIGTNQREFLCPLCKTIGNTLVPSLSTTGKQVQLLEITEEALENAIEFKYGSYDTDNVLGLAVTDFIGGFVELNRELSKDWLQKPNESVNFLPSQLTQEPLLIFQTIVNFISYEIHSIPLRGSSGFQAYLKNQVDRKPIISQIYLSLRELGKDHNIDWTNLAQSFRLNPQKLLKTQLIAGEVDFLEILVGNVLISPSLDYNEEIKQLIKKLLMFQTSLAAQTSIHYSKDFNYDLDHSSLYLLGQIAVIVLIIYKPQQMQQTLDYFRANVEDIRKMMEYLWTQILELENTPSEFYKLIQEAVMEAKRLILRSNYLAKYPWLQYFTTVPDFQLYSLPKSFIQFQLNTYSNPCKKCGTTAKNMACCLLCGQRLCLFSNCCELKLPFRMGEATQHSYICGAGLCAVATAFESGVISIDGGRCNDRGGYYVGELGVIHSNVSSSLVKWEKKFDELRINLLDYEVPTIVARERVNKDKSFKLFVV